MNGLDLVFLLVLVAGAWRGWSRGLLGEVLGLVGLFVGLYVASRLYEQVGYQLAPRIGTSASVAQVVAFILIWMGVPVVLTILGALLTQVLKQLHLDGINHLGGLVVGVVKYALLLGALANVLSITRIVSPEAESVSFLMSPLKATSAMAFTLAKSQWQRVEQ